MYKKHFCSLDKEHAEWHLQQLQSYFRKLQQAIDAGGKRPNYQTTIGKWFEEVCQLETVLGLDRVKRFKFLLLKYYFTIPSKGKTDVLPRNNKQL